MLGVYPLASVAECWSTKFKMVSSSIMAWRVSSSRALKCVLGSLVPVVVACSSPSGAALFETCRGAACDAASPQGGAAQGGAAAAGSSDQGGASSGQAIVTGATSATSAAGTAGASQGGTSGGSVAGDSGTGGQGGSPQQGAGGSAGSGGASSCSVRVGLPSDLTIYSGGDGACALGLSPPIAGTWFAFDDGSHMPPPGSSVNAQMGGRGGGCYVQGGGPGATNWGGGFGFALNGSGTAPCVFDASAYSGIHLYLRGNTVGTEGVNYAPTANIVRVNVVTTATSGMYGTCDPAQGQCDDHFGVWCPVGQAWAQCNVPFGNLSQRGWGAVETFDKSQLLQVQILAVRDTAAAGPTTWNVGADDVAFYP